MAMLNQLKCTVCYDEDTPLNDAEIKELLPQIPEWQPFFDEGSNKLKKNYRFIDFISALAFTQKVGDLAELECHHPTIIIAQGKAIVILWTHKIEGLHKNNFIMAAKTDRIYKNQ